MKRPAECQRGGGKRVHATMVNLTARTARIKRWPRQSARGVEGQSRIPGAVRSWEEASHQQPRSWRTRSKRLPTSDPVSRQTLARADRACGAHDCDTISLPRTCFSGSYWSSSTKTWAQTGVWGGGTRGRGACGSWRADVSEEKQKWPMTWCQITERGVLEKNE